MSAVKIATWNINSVRLRIESVAQFLKTYQPDILCLQETKVANELFPREAFIDMGYPHLAINGQKGYHGVATISRLPLDKVSHKGFCNKGDARHVCITLDGDLEIHNFYVPAGGDIPDPEKNDKFQHKLDFLTETTKWFKNRKNKKNNRLVLVGDLNIAPLEHDVWSHKQLLKVVSHTPIEVEHLADLQASHNWIDITREHIPEPEKIYTWWSYRSPNWDTSDKGRRLDHIWVTPKLKDSTGEVQVLRDVRGWERPSDHAPVMTTLKL